MLIEAVMVATFYAEPFLGRYTASGDIFVAHKLTLAFNQADFPGLHPKKRKMILLQRGSRKVWVKMNDLCPIPGRLDLSPAAAEYLGIKAIGKGRIRILKMRD